MKIGASNPHYLHTTLDATRTVLGFSHRKGYTFRLRDALQPQGAKHHASMSMAFVSLSRLQPLSTVFFCYVITGSFNWTEGAERRNRENLVLLDCPSLASVFSAEWDSIQRDKP
jgi:phosphatidylserine/phosphatidylglycerophosphate/cardiolipin synthase-like enzyme